MEINSTNCPLFNTGLYIEKINESSALASMCCYQEFINKTYDEFDFVNDEHFADLRKRTDNVTQCKLCFINESRNVQSYRQSMILVGNAFSDTPVLTTLTYNCENVCNLTCLTCGPRNSSKWVSLNQRMGYPGNKIVKISTHKNRLYKNLDLSNLKFLHFQGGEPLLTNDHIDIMKKLRDQNNLQNVIVSYNTNGTQFVDQEVIDLWSQAKLVKLNFSIDAVRDQFELIRQPGKWQQVEQTLFKYRDLNLHNLWLEIGTTLSLANLFYIQDLIDWRDQYYSKMLSDDIINIYVTIADSLSIGGRILMLDKMSDNIKQAALEYIKNITDESIRNTLISVINNIRPTNNITELIEYLDHIDQYCSTNWRTTLSELYQYIK